MPPKPQMKARLSARIDMITYTVSSSSVNDSSIMGSSTSASSPKTPNAIIPARSARDEIITGSRGGIGR
jgi:hypothetical protein